MFYHNDFILSLAAIFVVFCHINVNNNFIICYRNFKFYRMLHLKGAHDFLCLCDLILHLSGVFLHHYIKIY